MLAVHEPHSGGIKSVNFADVPACPAYISITELNSILVTEKAVWSNRNPGHHRQQ
jgi:hypothetical protein